MQASYLTRLGQVIAATFAHPASVSILPCESIPFEPSSVENKMQTRSGPKLPSTPAAPSIVIAPSFKLIFLTVVALTVASGLAQIMLAQHWPVPTDNQQQVFDSLGFAWKAGIGAIIGLLGGKAI